MRALVFSSSTDSTYCFVNDSGELAEGGCEVTDLLGLGTSFWRDIQTFGSVNDLIPFYGFSIIQVLLIDFLSKYLDTNPLRATNVSCILANLLHGLFDGIHVKIIIIEFIPRKVLLRHGRESSDA